MNRVLKELEIGAGHILQVVQGDITTEEVDAIVNAANAHLQHGAGVAGAISRKGGPVIQKDSAAWVSEHGPVTHNEPAWTSAGTLPAKFVIHAVGPIWGEGDEEKKLRAAISGSLKRADELKCTSISLPAISTGIFGFPIDRAAVVIMESVRDYFSQHASGIRTVRLVLFDNSSASVFLDLINRQP